MFKCLYIEAKKLESYQLRTFTIQLMAYISTIDSRRYAAIRSNRASSYWLIKGSNRILLFTQLIIIVPHVGPSSTQKPLERIQHLLHMRYTPGHGAKKLLPKIA